MKQETGKGIWLCGGANLAATLFAENLIDEIVLKVNPVLFGSGIPLFSGTVQQTDLELTGSKIYGNGDRLPGIETSPVLFRHAYPGIADWLMAKSRLGPPPHQ